MFNIGIRVDADNFTTETQAVVSDLQQTLNKNGITVPVNLNSATLKQMDEFIQSIGGSMKITKDALTGFIENISVDVPKANGQILSLNQGVQAVTNTVTDLNGVTHDVFSHFETTDITTTMNGMNTAFERAKELQSDIVKLYEQRVDLEHQMATALVNGDSKEQASLQAKLTKNEALDGMYREQLAYIQQQANSEHVQVNLWETINTQISQIDANTASWTRTLTQSGQDAIALAQNLSQSKKVLNDFANTYKQAMSTDGAKGQMLIQDLNNMKAQVDVVINAMTNLGATVDSTGAHYQGNITAVQELCTEYNKITRQLQEFNAQKQDQQNDTQMIEQTVQAYKAYRDQLDRINKLKKENATGVDMKAEQQQLDVLKTSYKQLEQGILSNGEAVYKNTQYNRDKNQVTRDSIQAQKELNVTLQDNSLQSLIADTITYTVSLQSLQQVIQSIISETVSLNDSMTQIRLVTQGSSDDTKALMSDYSNIAKQLGTTTSAVADSAVEWLRQGNTVEETSELVKASTTLSVIGAMDASDATTALTASLNGYKMEASDAMKIVDQLTTLDLKYATSSGDIANALSRVASSASAAGVPLERMEAIITVTADQTQQAAETIGRAWNSVIQRINKISAGKDVSDTGKSLNDVDKALQKVGISLRDDNGIIKASSDILDEVAAKWETWNRNEQSQIATAIAGTNQANIFRATMNDYKEVLEATTIAENASGSATERMSIYTESLTGKINTFKTAWTELVNDLNLDSPIGTVVDLGTKLLEILNLLLNKIPVLSNVLKGFITVKSINILIGAVISAIRRLAGPDGLEGLFDGFIKLKDTMAIVKGTMNGVTVETETMSVGSVKLANTITALIKVFEGAKQKLEIFKIMFVNAGGGVNGFVTALYSILPAAVASLSPLTLVAAGVAAVTLAVVAGAAAWLKYNSYAEQTARAVKSAQDAIDKAQAELDSANQDIDETNSKLSDLASQIKAINEKGTLTLADKAQKDVLQEQLDTLTEIKKTQEDIATSKNKALKKAQQDMVDAQYGNDKSADEWGSSLTGMSSRLYDTESASINQLVANINYLNKSKQDLTVTDESYNRQMKEQTAALNDRKLSILEQIQTLAELGDTSSEQYKKLQQLRDEIELVLDPSNYETISLDKIIDTAGVEDKLKKIIASSDEAGQKTAENYAKSFAKKILSDTTMKENWAKAMNIDVDDLNIDNLTQEIFNKFHQMFSDVSEDSKKIFDKEYGFGDNQVADWSTQATAALVSQDEALKQYLDTVQSASEKQEILNKAYSEMKEKGELTVATVQKLIEQEPSLTKAIEIQDGKIRINIDSLQDLSAQYYDTAIETAKEQKEQTDDVIDNTKTRIKAMQEEMTALELIQKRIDAGEDVDPNVLNQYKGYQRTQHELEKQGNQAQATSDDLAAQIEALEKLRGEGLTYTPSSKNKSGSSGSKTDPEKEAYELKKSEIEVVQKQLELEKSKLEQQKKGLEQQKSALELDKSQIELQKQIKEQQLDIIEDAEDGIDDIIELIKKMTKQDYENLKTKLGEIKDYIGDFKDALDDVKDTYDDLVDDAKDKLKAEKEAADNQKKLEDGAKSIAEIQAQLAEIQYDDSADAQAKRLELTASLNEKQQDLEDEMKDQAYDAATDALDKTKDKVDNIFDAIGDILDASQDAIADYITYISDELESEGNLYQAAVAQFNDTSEGAQEELYNRLINYNNKYGDSINKTVTEPWNEAIAAVEKYKEVAGSADIDTIRQYLGGQDTQLNASIKLDEQTIDNLDNQIDQIKMDMDKVDQQVTQFEQAISKVKDALSQLEINYKAASNTSDSGEQGVGNTGTDYAYGLIKGLLEQAGVDTSTLPETYQGFVDALSQTTEAATGASEALDDFTDKTEDTAPEVEDLGDKSEDAGNQTGGTVEPLKDLADSGEQAAGALSGVANAASGGSSGSGFGNLLTFLTGGDTDKFVQQFATKAISKYLPKLIKAGIGMIGKLHNGTDEVKKSNSWLDKMLGLGQDETARILKVGEAVIPDYANDAVQNMDSSAIRPTVTAPNTSNVRTTNNSELNIDMGDLDISGIDTTELRNELANIKKESANQVYSTLYRYIKVGGYRNVRNRYN
nr:MAG TPA: minor tail protein [Caudoviricetes sp.]